MIRTITLCEASGKSIYAQPKLLHWHVRRRKDADEQKRAAALGAVL